MALENGLSLILILSKKYKASFIFLPQLITPTLLPFPLYTKRIKALNHRVSDLKILSGWTSVNLLMLQTESEFVRVKKKISNDWEFDGNKIELRQPRFVIPCLYHLFLSNLIISAFWNIAVIFITSKNLVSKFLDLHLQFLRKWKLGYNRCLKVLMV